MVSSPSSSIWNEKGKRSILESETVLLAFELVCEIEKWFAPGLRKLKHSVCFLKFGFLEIPGLGIGIE
ncbi:hypothetical protein C1645_814859 [Glomus cerebriforme]|uniref:Uncharacterized protein n=1 Tax=Glomus cerebriforme TaxID=658196 RepID=A0A397TPP0_9GLOM|nr:hypothetical protein C1645_814859 [Glomus cerebriforme]